MAEPMSGWVNAPAAVLTHVADPAGQRGTIHHAHATTDWRVVTAMSVLLVVVTLAAYVRLFRRPSTRLDLVVLGACTVTALLWVTTDLVPEGAVLIGFSQAHGLTESDLLVFPLLLAAGLLLVRLIRTQVDRRSRRLGALR